jgi:uncharacterized membrane protein
MGDRTRFLLKRLGERLWVKPLGMCILSIAAVFLARAADFTELDRFVPNITTDSIETLLTAISTSMLVIATFAVASMVSAYASASTTATPRSFSLVIADDVSQNALSTFIGTFIFSIVALGPLKNGYYDQGGRFALFVMTLTAFAIVILTFVRWVDRIARLGRLGTTIDKVEAATAAALRRRRVDPYLHGSPVEAGRTGGRPVYGNSVGYVQRVDVSALQSWAKKSRARVTLAALPGTFSAPGRVLAYVTADSSKGSDLDTDRVAKAFLIGNDRTFDEDPRFGMIVLSEIANRALSPAVNDPGTAIEVIGSYVRLFALWREPVPETEERTFECDRVEVPELSMWDMFDDAFTPIARGGAGMVEVAVRLQKAFQALAAFGDASMREVAFHHSRLALARAEKALDLPEDLETVRAEAGFPTDIFREI